MWERINSKGTLHPTRVTWNFAFRTMNNGKNLQQVVPGETKGLAHYLKSNDAICNYTIHYIDSDIVLEDGLFLYYGPPARLLAVHGRLL